jgi:hypothetical protein
MENRYSCSLLRKYNWFKKTPYGYMFTHKYFITDTIHHLKMWIKTKHYRWWDYIKT